MSGGRPVRVKFEPRDLWLGAFIDTDKRLLYLCVVPCLPVILLWRWWTPFVPPVALAVIGGGVLRVVVGTHPMLVWWLFNFACAAVAVWMATLDAIAKVEAAGRGTDG